MSVTSTLTVYDSPGLTHNTVSGILNPSGHGAASSGSNITGVLLSSPPVFAGLDTLTDFPLGYQDIFLTTIQRANLRSFLGLNKINKLFYIFIL